MRICSVVNSLNSLRIVDKFQTYIVLLCTENLLFVENKLVWDKLSRDKRTEKSTNLI